ncbi:(2Fe-2S)-binding protein [Rhizobium herbae]|uniref:Molibdopterin-dependent oxidoreductase YjgC n=1 Tax=Rhizobium herbae TaxID=508661 RepID=A0ABS4EQS8_9HYPH|nr:(2Fe-2S)-binding protein [Rhizobium herbae]MBP1860300.1 putative molibdopterin-dependent oxidoreductase YjgC [Rhizobium herbae]
MKLETQQHFGDGRIVRLAEIDRPRVRFFLNGVACETLAGDTVLTAILACAPALRRSEFGPEARAGFCLMGACQDCWIWQEEGTRLRACSTPIAEGMRLATEAPECWP